MINDGEYDGEILYIDTENKKNRNTNDFEIDDGELNILPKMDTREIIYIAGPSGSGKSTLSANYIDKYRTLFPEREVYIFSKVNEDDKLDSIKKHDSKGECKITRVPLTADIHDIDIATELKDSLVLFDDCDTIPDKHISESVSKLKNDILETGRHYNIHCVITSHLISPNDRKNGRVILNECHSLCIFPKCGATQQITYALKTYFGFNNNQIQKIIELPSRWVLVNKSYPQYILYDKGCYIN